MSSIDALDRLLERFGAELLDLAEASIAHGAATGRPLAVALADFPPELARPGASFVTLHIGGELRGCTGTAAAYRPLAEDVAENAYCSAFSDPRFDPVAAHETARLETEISVLTEPEPMSFASEADLLAQLRPGRDGLILEAAGKRGLFLPQVWDMVGGRRDFLAHLKLKAGLDEAFWSPDLRVSRFAVGKTARTRADA